MMPDPVELKERIGRWAAELGFAAFGVSDIDLGQHEAYLERWLALGRQGAMGYMSRHGRRRTRPAELVPGTIRVLSLRMDYWPEDARPAAEVLADRRRAYLSRYALGRDYHKVLRRRLQGLARRIEAVVGPFLYRVFVDSAPVLEKALAERAGLGWIGKHTNVIERGSGSYFFLGEIYTDLPLPPDAPASAHCGRCVRCLNACPTAAIVAPYQLDARRCISYLTIEHPGSIDPALRPLLGNRIYGCDDCQLVCPWNKFARLAAEPDFRVRHGLDDRSLIELLAWTEDEFLARTEGSAIRRIGHLRWLRNLAVALGNAPADPAVVDALRQRLDHPSALVREHVLWALERQLSRATNMPADEPAEPWSNYPIAQPKARRPALA